MSSCYIYVHGTVGSASASVSPFRIFGTGPCECGPEGFNRFRHFVRKHQVKIDNRLRKCLKMNSLSVTNGKLAIPFFRNQIGNDRWQVRSRYKHISRGWAKSSVLQHCFTNLKRMRCTKVISATRFHEHELTRTEIAGVRMVAMHPVRDHLQQCD